MSKKQKTYVPKKLWYVASVENLEYIISSGIFCFESGSTFIFKLKYEDSYEFSAADFIALDVITNPNSNDYVLFEIDPYGFINKLTRGTLKDAVVSECTFLLYNCNISPDCILGYQIRSINIDELDKLL